MKSLASSRTGAFAALALLLTAASYASLSLAQPAQPPAPLPGPAVVPASEPPPPDAVAAAIAPSPGGLTADEVARLASTSSYSVATKQAELRAAAARVDQAFVNYFPRVTLSGTYTRLSSINPSSLGSVLASQDSGPVVNGPCPPPAPAGATCPLVNGKSPVASTALSFPVPVNSYSFVASLGVPLSDYVLRISQGYASASHAEKAKRLELEATTLQAGADARIALYNWIRARGQAFVTRDAVVQVKAHLEDAKRVLAAGLISPADVVRLDAQVAAAEQVEAEVDSLVAISEQQLRTAIHAPDNAALTSGVSVVHDGPIQTPPLDVLTQRALDRRIEIRALDETEYSLKEAESATKAGYLPRLDGFADTTYANPNPRIFPAQEKFDLTWDVGLRLSFVLNEAALASAQAAEMKARVATIAEQRALLRDGLKLEVAAAYFELKKSAPSLEAASRGVVAATESLRVRRELFRNGKATAIELVDAETELTRSRLTLLNAQIGLLIAQARLAHATGDDRK